MENEQQKYFSVIDPPTWKATILPLSLLVGLFVTGLVTEIYLLSAFAFLAAFACLLLCLMRDKYLLILALIPLSQPIPLDLGAKSIGIFPEYILLPGLFVIYILDRVRSTNLRFEKTGLFFPAILFMITAFISTIYSGASVGLAKTISGFGVLYAFLLSLIIFLLVLRWLRSEEQVKQAIFVILCTSLIVSLLGICEYVIQSGRYGYNYRIVSSFATIFWKEGGGNSNTLGAYLAMTTLLGISCRKVFQGAQRRLVSFSIILSAVATVMTFSRSSIVALAAGVLVIGFFMEKRLLAWVIPVSALAVSYLLTIPRIANRLNSILTIVTDVRVIKFFSGLNPKMLNWKYIGFFGLGGYDIDVVAGANRLATWFFGIKMFLVHPIMGIGLRMYEYYTGEETTENFFLDIAVMTGIVGLLCAIWLVKRIWKMQSRIKWKSKKELTSLYLIGMKAVFIAVIVISLTGSVMFNLKLILQLWVFLAILWRLSTLGGNEKSA